MLTIRPAQWPQDVAGLRVLETSFVTETIYRLIRTELSLTLVEETVMPPLRKAYVFRPEDAEERQGWDYAALAEDEGALAGFAAAQHTAWNRRVVVHALYVALPQRRCGVGTKLLDSLEAFALSVGARCLWLETQNVNVPAIRFYRRAGFHLCGFDDSLYDPADVNVTSGETALFFARAVERRNR